MSRKRASKTKRPAQPPPVAKNMGMAAAADDSSRNANTASTANQEFYVSTYHFKSLVAATLPHVFPGALAILLFSRTFIDGIVYPHYNMLFTGALTLLFVGWAGWAMWNGVALRAPWLTGLLAAFVAVTVLTAFQSIRLDTTFGMLPIWVSCFFVFVLGASALSRNAQNWMLAALILALGVEAIYSILHVHYILPRARSEVNLNPALVSQYFGAEAMTPDIKHRLESNRAFGTFLFPNALAAFLVLAGPVALALWIDRWGAYRDARRNGLFRTSGLPAPKPGGALIVFITSIASGLAAWTGVAIGMWMLTVILLAADLRGTSTLNHPLVFGFWVGIIPLLAGGGTFLAVRTYGVQAAGLILSAIIAPPVTVLAFWALALTSSRGGMLGLAVATILTCALLAGPRIAKRRFPYAATALFLMAMPFALAAAAQDPAPPVSVAQEAPGIALEGRADALSTLASGATFRLRIEYWSVGWAMALDNLRSGVGAGNFGVAYTKYQPIGGPDVKMAHNDYLQAFCETGFAGGLLFAAFWAMFAIWGGLSLIRLRNDRLVRAGLYTGAMAFALHQFVDFGFQNPSLSTWTYLLAGLFVARSLGDTPIHGSRAGRIAVYPFLLVAGAFALGGMGRIHAADKDLQSIEPLRTRLEAGMFLMSQALETPSEPGAKWSAPAPVVLSLVDNSKALETIGWFQAPIPGSPNRVQRIPVQPTMPPDAFFIVESPENARHVGRMFAERFLERAQAVDAAYPYRVDLAMNMYFWYELLLNTADGEAKLRYAHACLDWADKMVQRSPSQGWHFMWRGKALWYLGSITGGNEGLEYLNQGITSFAEAAALYPSSPDIWTAYAEKSNDFAALFERLGDLENANAYRETARHAYATAEHAARMRRQW